MEAGVVNSNGQPVLARATNVAAGVQDWLEDTHRFVDTAAAQLTSPYRMATALSDDEVSAIRTWGQQVPNFRVARTVCADGGYEERDRCVMRVSPRGVTAARTASTGSHSCKACILTRIYLDASVLSIQRWRWIRALLLRHPY